MKFIWPFYIYSGSTIWIRILAWAQAGHIWGGILNFASGPGTANRDPNNVKLVESLRKTPTKLFGYVSTRYGDRPLAEVKADVAAWRSLWGIADIFVDEVSTKESMVGYYAELNCWITGLTILNCGVTPAPQYLKAGDIICTAEHGKFSDYAKRAFSPWDAANRAKLYHIVMGCELIMVSPIIEKAKPYAEYLFVSDLVEPTVFTALPATPNYLERVFGKLRTGGGGLVNRLVSMFRP